MAETTSDSGASTHPRPQPESSKQAPMVQGDRFRVQALRDFLRGSWQVERTIHDRRAGLNGSFSGLVTFMPDDGGLRCREEGRMVLGGFAGLAHRDYLYSFSSPRRAEVRFADGRTFHDLDLSTGHWTALHLCPPDRYEGRFTAQNENRWLTIWEIKGPNKADRLRSVYVRGTEICGSTGPPEN